jgi:NADH-quinone oxidoreductase subunit K
VIHLIGPAMLASALAGIGVYGLLARRNAVLVLIGAELLLNAANVLLITASALPPGGLAAWPSPGEPPPSELTDPLLSGQVMAIFVITIAAAEIGVGLAIVLLLFRTRATSDLTAVEELGEASKTYTENPAGPLERPPVIVPDGEEPDTVDVAEVAVGSGNGTAGEVGERVSASGNAS